MLPCRAQPVKELYSRRLRDAVLAPVGPERRCLRLVHISDTHGSFYDVPEGDILIHSGDFSNYGLQHGLEEVEAFVSYFKSLPHQYKVLVPGNHELYMDRLPLEQLREMLGCTPGSNRFLLVDEEVTIEGIKFYGSPWTQCSMAWAATTETSRAERWRHIPEDTDVLVTHMPPYKIFDLAWQPDGKFYHWGCQALLKRIGQVLPTLHCFGHVHDEVGRKNLSFGADLEVMFSNAAFDLKRTANLFDFHVPVEPPAVMAPPAAAVDPPATMPATVGYLQVTGQDLVLDLDAEDPAQETVFLWKRLPANRPNQLWQLHQIGDEHSCRYGIRSMCNGQLLQRIGDGLKAMTWAEDGVVLDHNGCTLVCPRRLRSGQLLEIAPVPHEEALKLEFLPVECF
ncbi:unnamed protein product [Durusdinium trenchii]|uniref:Calcineurin-like phosphoesterase domain-containing protein n=1 Tax=Durusdinium trenchii TaxID=1381693 RepID=A0ABP0L4F5_9DINO